MQAGPVVGIIANPVSARDIRRVIANATALQITDRANIVLRVLACLKACGVDEVVMMPENGGIRHHVTRGIDRSREPRRRRVPRPRLSRHADHRHRRRHGPRRRARCARSKASRPSSSWAATAPIAPWSSACGDVPIAGISTGTNNAFPEHREPTITGLAVGLAVTGQIPPAHRVCRQQASGRDGQR